MTKNTNEQLIQDNYRNVYALAHSLAKSFEAFEDLQKVGYISLIEQSKTFDENSGVPFWTYACKGVKLKMLEELRFILDTVSISPYLNKQIGKVRKIVSANAESNTSELIEIVRFNAGAGKSGFCHAVGGQSGRHSKSSASGIYPNVFWHRVRSADL